MRSKNEMKSGIKWLARIGYRRNFLHTVRAWTNVYAAKISLFNKTTPTTIPWCMGSLTERKVIFHIWVWFCMWCNYIIGGCCLCCKCPGNLELKPQPIYQSAKRELEKNCNPPERWVIIEKLFNWKYKGERVFIPIFQHICSTVIYMLCHPHPCTPPPHMSS